MKRTLVTFVLSFIILMLFSCAKEKQMTIAVIPKATSHVFWNMIHAGAEKASQELGVPIIWQGPQKEDDREQQINVVQNFISRGISGIVLAPLDEVALIRPVKTARKWNIPVVIIDSDLKEKEYSSFVATDNYLGGKIAAEHLAKILGGQGNVLLLKYVEGSASTTKREKGFLDAMAECAPNVNLVSIDQHAGVTVESALQVSQNLLNKYTELDGIFCPNESSTFGMLRALKTAGRAGTIKFIGFDASEPLLEALRNGEINGLVVQNPFKMGYLGVKTCLAVIKGETVEPRIDTGVQIVTVENMNDPAIQEIVSPDIKKWLGE